MENTIQKQASAEAYQKANPKMQSVRNRILLTLWREGTGTRQQIFQKDKFLRRLNPHTSSGRFTELTDDGLIYAAGRYGAFTVYGLTSLGKEKVRRMMPEELAV